MDDKGTDNTTAFVIAGDIGGTNSRLSLYKAEENATALVWIEYLNKSFLDIHQSEAFPKILNVFLDVCKEQLAEVGIDFSNPTITACFACAGPVKNNKCEFSNNSFVVDGQAIENALNIHVRINLVFNFPLLFCFPLYLRFLSTILLYLLQSIIHLHIVGHSYQ